MKTNFLNYKQEATMDGSAPRTTARHASVATEPQHAGAKQAPATSAPPRYLFRDNTGTWRCASEIGLETGLRQITGDISALNFDTAITLAHHYRDQADAAEKLGYAIAEEDWSTWAELLEIWAAQTVSAPGQLRTNRTAASEAHSRAVVIRYHTSARFDGDEPTFSEMVGHQGGRR